MRDRQVIWALPLPLFTGKVGMQIEFTVQTWREGAQFIAHAMPLDVASSGPTPAAARAALDEAVRLFS